MLHLLQDEQRPRFGVSSWTSDLDASQNGISSSQGKFWDKCNIHGESKELLQTFLYEKIF